MPEKKKSTADKSTARRMTNPQPSKPAKPSESGRPAAAPRSGAAAVAEPVTAQKQLAGFETAVKFFHARRFREARDAFLQAREGPQRDIAQRADVHARMCERRLEQSAVALQSAEDHYNYAITLINSRQIAAAQQHLETALGMSPDSDHVLYALALVRALSGDVPGSAEYLRRAIDLEPRNRIAARQDTDFAPFVGQPPLDSLLYPEKRGWQS
jgi:tetratricopeptide (TPR) repeat protein